MPLMALMSQSLMAFGLPEDSRMMFLCRPW
ncbi:hypothetical protein SFUMM280S_10219 [Streptomyces fumanus]